MKQVQIVVFAAVVTSFAPLAGAQSGREDLLSVKATFTADFKKCDHPSLTRMLQRSEVPEADALAKLFAKRVGVWVSDDQNFSFIPEWSGVNRLRLEIAGPSHVRLFLGYGDGNFKQTLGDEPAFITDYSIFIGPKHSGWLFYYTLSDNRMYTLFSPHGIQARIAFTKTEDVAADFNQNPTVAEWLKNFNWRAYDRSREKLSRKIAGMYRREALPPEDTDYEELFMVIPGLEDNNNRTHTFYKEKKKYYWLILDYPPGIGLMTSEAGPFGAWTLTQSGDLVFTRHPPTMHFELTEQIAERWKELGKPLKGISSKVQFEKQAFDRSIEGWRLFPNIKRQVAFKKITPLRLSPDDFGYKTPLGDIITVNNEEREWLQLMLDEMYKSITVEDKK